MDENASPAPEIPASAPVPTENPTPPAETPAPPPAAALVVSGTKSEREIQLERDLETERDRAKRAEIFAAEKEREAETLREIQSRAPAAPKVKRTPHWSDPVFSDDTE